MVTFQNCDFIDPEFHSFLYKPFYSVSIFSRGDGYVNKKIFGMFLKFLVDHKGAFAWIWMVDRGLIEETLPICQRNAIALFLSENFNHMTGFICIKV